MGVLLYHFAGVAPSRDAILARYPRFEYAFPAGVEALPRGANGPGGDGALCACARLASQVRYEPNEQVWHPIADGVHCGWWNDQAPGPRDLAGERVCRDGIPVRLADSRQWVIPVVRYINGDTGLPAILRYDYKTGSVSRETDPKYVELSAMCDRIFMSEVGADAKEYKLDELFRLGMLALSVNYRVREPEVSMLGLLSTSNVQDIADAVLDGPNLRKLISELQSKKNDSDHGPDTKTGDVGSPGTIRPEPKSNSTSTSDRQNE